MNKSSNARKFTRSGKTTDFLQEIISAIPKGTSVYVIGGAIRNALYFELFHKALPQRDYDLLVIGDFKTYVAALRKSGFVFGKIRRKNQLVLKKKRITDPQSIRDYFVLDIHASTDKSVQRNLLKNAAFTINGFAIPLENYLAKRVSPYVIALPGAQQDLKKRQLRLTKVGYLGHPATLFACLRFMSIGFQPPNKKDIPLLVKRLSTLEHWRFDRNVQKVFEYVGGEKKARMLVKKLGITEDVFVRKT